MTQADTATSTTSDDERRILTRFAHRVRKAAAPSPLTTGTFVAF